MRKDIHYVKIEIEKYDDDDDDVDDDDNVDEE